MFCVGNIGMLNMFLNGSINNITNINAADAIIAHTSFLLLNTFVLNIDFLLSLTLTTCTSSDKASVTNAIVCPTSILDCSSVNPFIGSFVVASPIAYAASVSNPIIIP